MHRLLILVLLLFALPAWAQETDDADPEPTEAEEAADPAEDAADEAIDELDFSDELYSDEEDAFIPSENVKFGQSIPFPTDI